MTEEVSPSGVDSSITNGEENMPTIVQVSEGGGQNQEVEHSKEVQNQSQILGPLVEEKGDNEFNGESLTEPEGLGKGEFEKVADTGEDEEVSDRGSTKAGGSDVEESSEVCRTDGQKTQGTDGTVEVTRSESERMEESSKEGENRILNEKVNRHGATWKQFDGTAPDDHKDGVQSEGNQAPGERPQLRGVVENNGSRDTGPNRLSAQSISIEENRGGPEPTLEELKGAPLGPPPDPVGTHNTNKEGNIARDGEERFQRNDGEEAGNRQTKAGSMTNDGDSSTLGPQADTTLASNAATARTSAGDSDQMVSRNDGGEESTEGNKEQDGGSTEGDSATARKAKESVTVKKEQEDDDASGKVREQRFRTEREEEEWRIFEEEDKIQRFRRWQELKRRTVKIKREQLDDDEGGGSDEQRGK